MNPFIEDNDVRDPRNMFSVKMGNGSTNVGSLENNFDPSQMGEPMGMNCRKDMPDRYIQGVEGPYQEMGDQAGANVASFSKEDYAQSSEAR